MHCILSYIKPSAQLFGCLLFSIVLPCWLIVTDQHVLPLSIQLMGWAHSRLWSMLVFFVMEVGLKIRSKSLNSIVDNFWTQLPGSGFGRPTKRKVNAKIPFYSASIFDQSIIHWINWQQTTNIPWIPEHVVWWVDVSGSCNVDGSVTSGSFLKSGQQLWPTHAMKKYVSKKAMPVHSWMFV